MKPILRRAVAIVLGVSAIIATAGAVWASPAVATNNLNVRQGPGLFYGAVGVLKRGEQVDVDGCRNGWCYVRSFGVDGWVSSSYLAAGPFPSHSPAPSINFQFNITPPAPAPWFRDYPRRQPRYGDYDEWNGGWRHQVNPSYGY